MYNFLRIKHLPLMDNKREILRGLEPGKPWASRGDRTCEERILSVEWSNVPLPKPSLWIEHVFTSDKCMN